MTPAEERASVPPSLAVAAAWSWRLLVIAGALVVAGFVLIQVAVVVVPVILALFIASVLEPLVAGLRRRRWPSAAAAAVVFVGFLALVAAVLAWIGTSVAGQFDELGQALGEGVDEVKEWAQDDPLNLSAEQVNQIEDRISGALNPESAGLSSSAIAKRARVATEAAGGLVLLLFTLFFVLKDGAGIAGWLTERVPPRRRQNTVAIARRTRAIMRQYLVATALTGFIDGVLIAIALAVLGVPLVVPLAVLTFLGGFIPIVGATVAGLVAALVALVDGGVTTALLVVAVTVAIQQIEGNLLQPLILERAVRLHPLVTVLAVGAGLVVGGLLGAFLAVPLVAIAAAAVSHLRSERLGNKAERADLTKGGTP